MIRSLTRRDDTILRLGGNGDNWHMSWASDDTQLTALCDGIGWTEHPRDFYNSRLYRVIGDLTDVRFEPVHGYPELSYDSPSKGNRARYYGFGTLALDGVIYQFLSTYSQMRPGGPVDLRFIGAKLIYSPDNGTSWRNQDGSIPVVWESWQKRSRENMVFFEEPGEAFSLLTVLQMGKNYDQNRDGYVYVYAPNGNIDGTMNELVMLRVPKDQILDRGCYEYFAGREANGDAHWTRDIEHRGIVHAFPLGWVNQTLCPYAWHPSVVYYAPLEIYLMANWGMGVAPDGSWFGKPSYLGFWVAEQPWGPWEQIHEETAWTPGGDLSARCYQPQIAPKWIAQDGSSFWLVWTDFQMADDSESDSAGSREEELKALAKRQPYYAFNTQRVDLK